MFIDDPSEAGEAAVTGHNDDVILADCSDVVSDGHQPGQPASHTMSANNYQDNGGGIVRNNFVKLTQK